MRIDENNNRNIMLHLAKSSIKTSKLRNFFTVFAIVLSASLLMTMGTYVLGTETAMKRQVDDMQQVIYNAIDETQAQKMAEDEGVSYLRLIKLGQGIEIDNKILQPSYLLQDTLKGEKGDVKTAEVEKGGKYPEKYEEAAVTREYCELIGIAPVIGTAFSVEGVDGIKEEFVISGILEGSWGSYNVYPLYLSERYAKEGHFLKDIPFDALVKLTGGESMHQQMFEEEFVRLGTDYGVKRKDMNPNNYFLSTLKGDDIRTQQRIAVVGVGIGILFASLLVIYSVFYLSVIGRIRQFGQLRTIGMTKKQIGKMVRREGIILSLIGITFGLLIGGTVAYFLKPTGWDWIRTIGMAAVVAVVDILMVQLSLAKPAKLASEISPIEAARFTGDMGKGKAKLKKQQASGRTRKLQRDLSSLGMARISAGRNRKKSFLTMLSLGIGGVLFMVASTFVVSLNLDEYSRQREFAIGEYAITLSSNAAEASEHGWSGIQKNNPLNQELIDRIRSLDGVKKVNEYQQAAVKWEANGEAAEDALTGFDQKLFDKIKKNYVDKETVIKDLSYEKMAENKQIFILHNSVVEEIFGWKFAIGDKVKLSFDNASQIIEEEYTVAGFIEDNDYFVEKPINGLFQLPQVLVDQVAGDLNLNQTIIVSSDETKEKALTPQIESLTKENPNLILNTLKEQREQEKSSFMIIYTVILGLSIFIIGFSMLNLLNTLITNIITRKQEFAMLESVGMSHRQLNRMLGGEGLILSAGNALITLIVGTVLGYGGVTILRELAATYMHYHFPGWFFLGYVVVLIIIPLLVTTVMLHGFERQALTERLRVED